MTAPPKGGWLYAAVRRSWQLPTETHLLSILDFTWCPGGYDFFFDEHAPEADHPTLSLHPTISA
jgi:hypothetical protein